MDHKRDAGWPTKSRIASLCLGFLFALGVGACSPHIPPRPLPELNTPGVSKVPGFDSFFKTVDVHPHDELGGFTAYQPGGSGKPGRLLLPLEGKLYDIGLDGKLPRTIQTPTDSLIDACDACFERQSMT
jgi:hypothetical protein